MKNRSFFLFMFFYCVVFGQINKQELKFGSNMNLPVGFMENKGQVLDQNYKPNRDVKYLFNSPGLNVALRQTGFSYDSYIDLPENSEGHSMKKAHGIVPEKNVLTNYTRNYHRVEIELVSCNPHAGIVSEDPSAVYTNYFISSTPAGGASGVHFYRKIIYKNIYPYIDLVFNSGNQINTSFEYTFIIHPGGKVSDIQLTYKGAKEVTLLNGRIEVKVDFGTIRESIPASYWLDGKENQPVKSDYLSLGKNLFGFSVAFPSASGLNTTESDLVIDPVPALNWATTLGTGSNQVPYGLVADAAGNVYNTGLTQASSIATAGAYQTVFGGGQDAYVAKLNATGTLIWCTFYGGSGTDRGCGIGLASDNSIYVAGYTNSKSGIATAGAYQTAYGGGTYDAFVAKFNNSGTSLLWASYYGGTDEEYDPAIAIDANDNVFITGTDQTSTGNPTTGMTTPGAFQTSFNCYTFDTYVAEFNSSGSSLLWGTYFGAGGGDGYGAAIALDAGDNVYITGGVQFNGISTPGTYQTAIAGDQDAFVAKFNPALSGANQLIWSTFFGGANNDYGCGIVLDACNNVFISGFTASTNGIAASGAYQTVYGGGSYDMFLAKLNSSGSGLLWSTYYGGTGEDCDIGIDGTTGNSIAIDPDNNIYLTGQTESTNAIATASAYQTSLTGSSCGFLSKFNSQGSLIWGTYMGTGPAECTGISVTLGACNNIYLDGLVLFLPSVDGGTAQDNIGNFIDGSLPVINVHGATTMCPGDSAVLTTDTCTRFQFAWSPSTGLNVSTGTLVKASPPTTQTYTVTATSASGCIVTSTVTVTINPVPDLAAATVTNTSCGLTNGSVIANASGGTGLLTYSWSNSATGATDSNLDASTYTLTVSDANGCTSTQNVSVSSSPGPTINSIIPADVVCKGSSTGSATVSASGSGTLTYSWSGGSTSLTGQGTTEISSLGSGTYSVTVTDGSGCLSISSVTITQPLTSVSLAAPVPASATCGTANGSAFTSATGGTGGYSYTWSSSASGQTASGLAGGNTYTVTVSDGNSCTAEATVTITNSNGPDGTASVSSAISCNGGTGSVSVNVTGGTSPYTYSWNSGPSSTTTALSNSLSGVNSATYTVTVTDANNCSSTSTVDLSQPPAIRFSASQSSPLSCLGGGSALASVALGGTGSFKYSWSSGASGLTATNLNATSYTVTATDANGCSSTSSVTISGHTTPPALSTSGTVTLTCSVTSAVLTGSSTGNTMVWNGPSVPVNSSNPLTVNAAGVYTVTATDVANGCTSTATDTVRAAAGTPEVSITPPDTLTCARVSVRLTGSSSTPGVNYQWKTGAASASENVSAAGIYTLIVTNPANSCTAQQTVTVASNTTAPSVTSAGGSLNCNFASVNLIGISPPGNAMVWNGGTLVNAANPAIVTTPGTYTVTATDAVNDCTASTTVQVTSSPNPTLSTDKTTGTCQGESQGTLSGNSTGNGTVTYNWSDSAHSGTQTEPSGSFTFGNLSAGTYTLTVTDANGCTATATAAILTLSNPTAAVSRDTVVIGQQNIQLWAGGGTSYLWTPSGTLSSGTVFDPIADPSQTTTYTVVISNANNCSATDSVKITVRETDCDNLSIFMPTAFSPNNDGVNDVLYLHIAEYSCIQSFTLNIFDRWGELVFQTSSTADGWDGTLRGQPMNQGVYVYYLSGTLSTGQTFNEKGNVTLLR